MTARSWYRFGLLALAAVAILGAGLQTGAFSAASVERPVQVDVVGDDEAMVGVEAETVEAPRGRPTEVELLRVTNRFRENVEVDVEIVDPAPGDPPRIGRGPPRGERAVSSLSLAPGETSMITETVRCVDANAPDGANATADVPRRAELDVRIEVRGEGVVADLSRTVEVACAPS